MKDVSFKFNFKCPVCGGSMFGTTIPEGTVGVGHCHNFHEDTGLRCNFTWDRRDDEDVFTEDKGETL